MPIAGAVADTLRAQKIPADSGSSPMSWILIVTGLVGAALLALGCDLIVPLGSGIGGLFALGGIASAMMFIGLIDGE
jgi:hypothetical protein